ncbi:nicotinamide-nucleotide adenylyltransferase [Candidatus Bathyarchaeota archaeon]|nr:nicotinamide-nucleotide adenylyltransferase [Candidatus Bathyarchaeota archaeon]MBT4423565.1 nicotinamide-nucleotide adenylyltransferase [Candidatus Bathyarchaeota archaeon]MBT5643198.1 nicotinamide-nucleotide adenylyltransferase [Candidatus Bathyarchaeota archaeon]MBT6605080.1 nicotinamide-nucleotide adenylyltransferase [Candidatus Bathyarchaeota archaeon]MBT7188488.1 nicotinamide-nucleotide adenylyltransferase [Candidatus Bathyarchaeota archaeon]
MKRALFIGRFQPFHFGHLHAIETILTECDELILVVGSAQMSHQRDNPFTAGERIEMIRGALAESKIPSDRYMIIPIPDAPAHRVWVSAVESQTPRFDMVFSNQSLTRRLLIEAGYEVHSIELFQRGKFEASDIRRRILEGRDWSELVPSQVYKVVQEIDGENRIRDLAKSDSLTQENDNHA